MERTEMINSIIEEIVEEVQALLGDTKVTSGKVTKNNGVEKISINVAVADNCSASLYVDEMIPMIIQKKMTAEEAAKKIAQNFTMREKFSFEADPSGILNSIFENKEELLSKVKPVLVNRNMNEAALKDAPSRNIFDLTVSYRVFIEDGTASFRLSNEIMEMAGVTFEDVEKAAFENLRQSYRVESLTPLVERMTGRPLSPDVEDIGMKVVTTTNSTYGAAVLADDEYLDQISKQEYAGEDYIILPSSIHEVITLPVSMGLDAREMAQFVCCVNETELSPQEVLSNSVYRYNVGHHRLEMIA